MTSRATLEKQASSKTLNKCIRELDDILTNKTLPTASLVLRRKYHNKLKDLIEEIASGWYQTGFERAHKTLFDDGDTKQRKLEKSMNMRAGYFRNGVVRTTLRSNLKGR